jgi:hypothetical protein
LRLLLCAVSAIVLAAPSAFAQTEGKVSVGGSVTLNATTDDGIASATTVGPVVRLNPRKGWRVAGGFNWFRGDLDNPAGGSGDFARLTVRPVMAGVSYTVGSQKLPKLLTSFAIVAGPSFNKAEFRPAYARDAGETISVDNSLAVRPGVSLTWTVAPRVAVIGFGGYFFCRPDTVYRNRLGQEIRNQWKADAVVLSVGAVYSLF